MDISAIKHICIDHVQVDTFEVTDNQLVFTCRNGNFISFNLMKHSYVELGRQWDAVKD